MTAAASANLPRDPLLVELQPERFRTVVDDKPVALYTLRNTAGAEASITNYGAKIEQLLVPDRDGVLGDVVLGYPSIDAVIDGHPSMNAFIGRYANRIGGARFVLDGCLHRLTANDGANTLHGGESGSRVRVFDARQLSRCALELRYVFRDGEEGFPGTLPLRVMYTVGDDDSLAIEWYAVAEDRATVASFTGHAFFNLAGDPRVSVADHVLTLNADRFLPVGPSLVPTGEMRPVAGTPMDFRRRKPIGQDIAVSDEQLGFGNGYDPCRCTRATACKPRRRTISARATGCSRFVVRFAWSRRDFPTRRTSQRFRPRSCSRVRPTAAASSTGSRRVADIDLRQRCTGKPARFAEGRGPGAEGAPAPGKPARFVEGRGRMR